MEKVYCLHASTNGVNIVVGLLSKASTLRLIDTSNILSLVIFSQIGKERLAGPSLFPSGCLMLWCFFSPSSFEVLIHSASYSRL